MGPEEVPHSAVAAYGSHGVEGSTQSGVGMATHAQAQEAQTHTMGAEVQTHMTGVAEGTHWTRQHPID